MTLKATTESSTYTVSFFAQMAALEEGFGLCKILLLSLVLVLAMVTTSLLLETLSPQIHGVDMF